MSIIFKPAVWEEAVRSSLVAVRRAGREQEVSCQVPACCRSRSGGNRGAEKEEKLLQCASWEEAAGQRGDGARTLQALLFLHQNQFPQ